MSAFLLRPRLNLAYLP